MTTVIYRGWLVVSSWGEADEILYLEREPAGKGYRNYESPLAERIQSDMEQYGRYLSVRYFTSDEEKTEEQLTLELARVFAGEGEADVGHRYSEVTGYLWTDEDIKVGGHDLMGELHGQRGKFLHLEIGYAQRP
jgi:hypothetical protein